MIGARAWSTEGSHAQGPNRSRGGCAWLALAQQTPLPECKPVTHYGVQGCELSAQSACPKGYHKQGVCPPNPLMKAPCYLMCDPDVQEKKKLNQSNANPEDLRPSLHGLNQCV